MKNQKQPLKTERHEGLRPTVEKCFACHHESMRVSYTFGSDLILTKVCDCQSCGARASFKPERVMDALAKRSAA